MKYEVLYANDDGTVKVRMTIDDRVLEQDFLVDNLDERVKHGMAIFQSELDRHTAIPVDKAIIGEIVEVSALPTIPSEDFLEEVPIQAVIDQAPPSLKDQIISFIKG